MHNPQFICNYRAAGKNYTLTGKTSELLDADYVVDNDKIKLTLKPKTLIELLDAKFIFDHDFKEGDKFFANGYQSWSTSREYT